MPEHPDPDLVLELALGQLSGPQRDELLVHVSDCLTCRADLEALSASVESALAVVPRAEPPTGFAAGVLARLEAEQVGRGGPPKVAVETRRVPTWVGIAAAAVLGLGLGAGLTGALIDRPAGAPATEQPLASQGAPLLTADGSRVGLVSRSWSQGEPVLVVDVSGGQAGRSYVCRLGLTDGATEDVGEWTLSQDRPNSWVIPDPGASTVELVTDSGRTWSSATL